MDYYIQGDAANAEKIKAVFEKLGVASNADRYNYKNDNVLYFTAGGMIHMIDANGSWANIIKTHPDYKELELPVEPKFKKGDWIACDADSFTLSIKSLKDGNYYFHQGASLPIKDIDEHYHLWTIADAKDGDIIGFNDCTCNDGSYVDWVGIYNHQTNDFVNAQHLFHCVITGKKNTFRVGKSWRVLTAYPATKEQRDLLFKKMREAGYEWDANKKELRKIKPHYDISNFYAGMPVLVRDDRQKQWCYALYSHYDNDESYQFVTAGNIPFIQCIPFNDDTKHLLGTTDMCDEQYINW